MKTSHIVIGVIVIAVIGFLIYMSTKKTTSQSLVYQGGQNPNTNPSTYLIPAETQGLDYLLGLLGTKKTGVTSPASDVTTGDQALNNNIQYML